MIRVEKISKSFKDTKVLQDISFDINRGDFVAIMGPSGSGKSTLLYSISGMDNINSGRVLFEGTNICEMKEKNYPTFAYPKWGLYFKILRC